MSDINKGINREGGNDKDTSPTSSSSSFQWAGVALQAAFSPGGTRSSSWSFLDKVMTGGGDAGTDTAPASDLATTAAANTATNAGASVSSSSSSSSSATTSEGVSVLEDIDGSSLPPHLSTGNSNYSDVDNSLDIISSKAKDEENEEGDDVAIDHDESGVDSTPNSPYTTGMSKKKKNRKKKIKTNY